MIKRRNGRMTVPQIFIGDLHVGGSDELHALERAGKLDPLLAQADMKGSAHERARHPRPSRPRMIQMRTGLVPAANVDAAARLIGEASRPAPTTCRRRR